MKSDRTPAGCACRDAWPRSRATPHAIRHRGIEYRRWMRKLIALAVVVCAACGGNKDDAAGSGSASKSPIERPAAITKEMQDTFDAYISAFEKLVSDIGAAIGDCKAIVAAIERN